MSHQNWEQIILRPKKQAETVKRAPGIPKIMKDLYGDDPTAPPKVSSALRKAIQQARLAKKMSQADLAKAACMRPDIIKSLEDGSAMPDPAVLSKLSRVLGVTLKKDMK